MVSAKVKLINPSGLHMRPANDFVKAMSKYSSKVSIVYKDKLIDGKSIMNIMASCLKKDSELEVQCTGSDEEAMLKEAVDLIESGFGE